MFVVYLTYYLWFLFFNNRWEKSQIIKPISTLTKYKIIWGQWYHNTIAILTSRFVSVKTIQLLRWYHNMSVFFKVFLGFDMSTL